ncbi:hypothetical protein, partial [Klebsiella michiganensis]
FLVRAVGWLFTLANLFRVDQMIRQWERSQ